MSLRLGSVMASELMVSYSDITVSDICADRFASETLCNADFIDWLKKDRPEWSKIRWSVFLRPPLVENLILKL